MSPLSGNKYGEAALSEHQASDTQQRTPESAVAHSSPEETRGTGQGLGRERERRWVLQANS